MKRTPKTMKGHPRVTDGLAADLESNQLRLGQEDRGPGKDVSKKPDETNRRKIYTLVMVEDEFLTGPWNTEQIKMNLFLLIINSREVKNKQTNKPEKESLIIVDQIAWL